MVLSTAGSLAEGLERGLFAAGCVDLGENPELACSILSELRRRSPSLPLFAIASEPVSAESGALVREAGADACLDGASASATLSRLLGLSRPPPLAGGGEPGQESAPAVFSHPAMKEQPGLIARDSATSGSGALPAMRDFSQILHFEGDDRSLIRQFMLKLRGYLPFGRMAVFLSPNPPAEGKRKKNADPSPWVCAASLGIPEALVQCLALHPGENVAATLLRHPAVISSGMGSINKGTVRELELLGCRYAIPIQDGERVIGAALLSGPVTGRAFSEEELQSLFLMMEELGLAIRQARMRGHSLEQGRLFEAVLASVSAGILVVSPGPYLVHVNPAASALLGLKAGLDGGYAWESLPDALVEALSASMRRGEVPAPFELRLKDELLLRVSLVAMASRGKTTGEDGPWLVVLEDYRWLGTPACCADWLRAIAFMRAWRSILCAFRARLLQ